MSVYIAPRIVGSARSAKSLIDLYVMCHFMHQVAEDVSVYGIGAKGIYSALAPEQEYCFLDLI